MNSIEAIKNNENNAVTNMFSMIGVQVAELQKQQIMLLSAAECSQFF